MLSNLITEYECVFNQIKCVCYKLSVFVLQLECVFLSPILLRGFTSLLFLIHDTRNCHRHLSYPLLTSLCFCQKTTLAHHHCFVSSVFSPLPVRYSFPLNSDKQEPNGGEQQVRVRTLSPPIAQRSPAPAGQIS